MRVADVLATAALGTRAVRPVDHAAESGALAHIAKTLVDEPGRLPGVLSHFALQLCNAGSAGISFLESDGPDGVFRLQSVVGGLSHFTGSTTPREWSPCGTTVDLGEPQLFLQPGRVFSYWAELVPPILEALVIPILAGPRAVGAIWIVAHKADRHFDSEDVRVMSSLAHFTGAAWRLQCAPGEVRRNADSTGNQSHVARLASSCRESLNTFFKCADTTCGLAKRYPLSTRELGDLQQLRDEEHNAYWAYMDLRQELLNLLVLDARDTPSQRKKPKDNSPSQTVLPKLGCFVVSFILAYSISITVTKRSLDFAISYF
ncbi:MAG TPA: GAF domain-containing protein [Bryobacteraceae bacterium]|nr:GAF domain-containing protein [Bryobacteraceae bacterium]